jgi:ParB-like nuclease family protein
MTNPLELHPLAALFPELLPAELAQLALDIKERGQLEPIIIYKGLILDGHNRYRACQIAGVKPRLEEFNAKVAKRSPEEFVLSRNLRRRHLSVGQKAAIALDWADQIELSPDTEKNKERGRPKGALSEAAKKIGISEQRVFEVRQIRDASPSLYQDLKAGRRSLNGALAEISPPRDTGSHKFGLGKSGSASQQLDGSAQQEMMGLVQPSGRKVPRGAQKPASKEATAAVKLPPSPAATEKALARIKAILGSWFYAEVKARNLIQKPEEIVQFAKLTDAQMLEIGPLLKRGWTFVAAIREVVERLTPDDPIRALHTRAVENGGNWCLFSVGSFGHVVVWGRKKINISPRLETLWRGHPLRNDLNWQHCVGCCRISEHTVIAPSCLRFRSCNTTKWRA